MDKTGIDTTRKVAPRRTRRRVGLTPDKTPQLNAAAEIGGPGNKWSPERLFEAKETRVVVRPVSENS